MKTNHTPHKCIFDPARRHGDRNGKRILLSAAAMTVLMGVAACEGPPILKVKSVDEHAGQDYLNPPEVESVFEEPSSDAEGEIPLPLGFTEESWEEFLLEKLDEGFVVNHGGLDVVVATMDSPLAYDGPVPTVRFIALEKEEMDALGVEPGDHAPGSTAMHKRIYIYALEADPSNIVYSAVEGETSSKGTGDIVWADRVGSPLAFATDSNIAITGCADYDFPSWPFADRRGIARFYGSWTTETRDVQVRYPSIPCSWWSSKRTTVYAKAYVLNFSWGTFYLWIVNEPEVWIAVGQDGWDDIKLFGDKQASSDPLKLKRVVVMNNNKLITSNITYFPAVTLSDSFTPHDLSWRINNYKQSKVFHSSHPVVMSAASDYAQAASVKYPVYPHPSPWHGHTVPYDWCTEFASWAFLEGAPSGVYPYLPIATTVEPNIGVREFWNWGDSEGLMRTPLEFGIDEQIDPLVDNGPTHFDWYDLDVDVKEGDYLGRREEHSTGTHVHSMIVVGWLNNDGTDVDPLYFENARYCNRLLVVDGNTGGPSSPGAWGLGSTVNVSRKVICRPVEDPVSGFSVDPDCDINDNGTPNEAGELCDVRLWDTHDNGIKKSSFFIDMSY